MTKQLNKKGTSLVELIAVIVIMGIIAGIAIPTTIAVINRQKKNAAVKSVEALVSTMKNILNEAQAYSTGTAGVSLTVKYGSGTTEASTPLADGGIVLTGTSMTITAADLAVDNLSLLATSGITINLSADGVYTATAVTVTSNGQSVSIAANCKCSAA